MAKKDITKYSVRELFDIVRKGMIWRGKSIENKVDRNTTAKMWIEEVDITPGIFSVKSSAMHDNYMNWCKERGITGNTVLSNVALGRYLKDNFRSVIYNNSTHYYINKNLVEDDEEKKKRQEAYLKRQAKKAPKESSPKD